MISFDEACLLAKNFYKEKLNITGLAEAMETDEKFIFSGGNPGSVNYGSCIIAVDKADGQIKTLKFPSKENSQLIKSATKRDLPDQAS